MLLGRGSLFEGPGLTRQRPDHLTPFRRGVLLNIVIGGLILKTTDAERTLGYRTGGLHENGCETPERFRRANDQSWRGANRDFSCSARRVHLQLRHVAPRATGGGVEHVVGQLAGRHPT